MAQYASLVIITTPSGVFNVIERSKPLPHYPKFPGGASENGETPFECAVREIKEEIGVELTIYDLKEVYREQKRNHVLVFFQVELSNVPPHRDRGEESGEEVYLTPLEELLPNLFPPHRAILERVTDGGVK